ncbi:MAG TPA: 7-cyano-7-deazaguanine synthase QueC [Fimbriimonadaceae bacterium]|nr:7-cyano-7-deazaguanine synthase QueC [Fimbriimonadaceae bacterium]
MVLHSGGLDSTTVLAIAKAEGFRPHALTVVYGQRHRVEVDAARRVCDALGVDEHKIVHVELDSIGGSALTDDFEVPKGGTSGIPITYVPARNTIFLSIALGYAEVIGASDIFVGVNTVDYSGYPDCRPEFIRAFEALATVATKAGVEGKRMTIHAPLMELSKPEIIQKGLSLGIDYSLTHSCYDPHDGSACGLCDSCRIRQAAFEKLGLVDPALPDRQ